MGPSHSKPLHTVVGDRPQSELNLTALPLGGGRFVRATLGDLHATLFLTPELVEVTVASEPDSNAQLPELHRILGMVENYCRDNPNEVGLANPGDFEKLTIIVSVDGRLLSTRGPR